MAIFQNTTAVLCCAVALYVVYTIYKAYTDPLADVPGPFWARFTRLWLLKAVAGRKFDRVIIDLHRRHGPLVRLSPNEFSVDDPDAAKIIYRQRDQLRKAPRYAAWGDPTQEPNIFISSNVAHHAHRRKQIQQLYNLDQLFAIEHRLDQATELLLERFDNFANNNTTFDMAQWIQFYTFDSIACLTFGKPIGFLKEGKDIGDIQQTLHTYAAYGGIVGVYYELHNFIFSILSSLAPRGEVGLAAVVAFKNRQVDVFKVKAQQQAEHNVHTSSEEQALKDDYLTSLYAKHIRNPAKFTMEDVDYHSINNVVAGSETTGITLCAALRYLVIHPSVMGKLRTELDAFWFRRGRMGLLQMKETRQLPYLQAVIKETLRLFPGNGLNLPRVIPKGGLQLAGRFFPEGTTVGVNAYSVHANRAVFGLDADEFRPERWMMDPERVAAMDSYFFSFGRGPRSCAGKHIALIEISKALPELLLHYDISYADIKHDWSYANDWFVLQRDWQVKIQRRNLPVPVRGDAKGMEALTSPNEPCSDAISMHSPVSPVAGQMPFSENVRSKPFVGIPGGLQMGGIQYVTVDS